MRPPCQCKKEQVRPRLRGRRHEGRTENESPWRSLALREEVLIPVAGEMKSALRRDARLAHEMRARKEMAMAGKRLKNGRE